MSKERWWRRAVKGLRGRGEQEAGDEPNAAQEMRAALERRVLRTGREKPGIGGGDRRWYEVAASHGFPDFVINEEYLVIHYHSLSGQVVIPSWSEAWPERQYSVLRTYAWEFLAVQPGENNLLGYHVFTHYPPGFYYNEFSPQTFNQAVAGASPRREAASDDWAGFDVDSLAAEISSFLATSERSTPITAGRSPIQPERLFFEDFKQAGSKLQGEWVEPQYFLYGDRQVREGIHLFNKQHGPADEVLVHLFKLLSQRK